MGDADGSCRRPGLGVLLFMALAMAGAVHAQGFPNVPRTPGAFIAGPIAPEQGRTAIVAWHGERIVSVPEIPGSQNGADYQTRIVDIQNLDTTGPEVTVVPVHSGGFLSHGYYQTGPYLHVGQYCLGDALDACNGTYPHDVWRDGFRIGGPGTPIGGSQLRPAFIDEETGLLLGTYDRAGAQSPWGLNSYWTYNAIGGDMWLAVRRNNEWVYDWGAGGTATGPAIKARWDHLGLTGVTGFPFIMGNILIVASDQAGTGVASYDISDVSSPVLLDVLKEGNPGGYWPEIYGHYIVFPRRDGEGGVGSQAGYMVVDFEDPADLKVVANRNVPGSNQYVTFQDEYAFMNRYKIDMRTFDVALTLPQVPDIDTSQFSLPVGNLVITGGYGLDGPGLAVWAHQAEPDTRGPFVAYHVPVPDQTNFSVDCPITLSIPETLKTETIVDGTSLILRPVGGSAVPTWHAFGQGKLLTVTPQQPLQPNTTYEFLLTSDIQDAAGNGMEPYSFRFSTGGSITGGNRPPAITGFTATPEAPQPGALVTFAWTGSDADGDAMQFRLDPGDGSEPSTWSAGTTGSHTYTAAGHFQVTLQVRDAHGSVSAYSRKITVITPPGQSGSTASSMVALDTSSARAYVVNPDNDTVTAVDTESGNSLWEVAVGTHPAGIARANDGSLWVACRDSDEIRVLLPTGDNAAALPLDYGARPVAICRTPDGAAMLVSLEGENALLRYTVATRTQNGVVALGPMPRAIAVTHDGSRALVTRFISGEHEGSVYVVALAGGMSLSSTVRLARDHSVDGSASGRGVPNYLAGIRISPDGAHAWVVGKKDNTSRGTFTHPDMVPGQDSTVRALAMLIDLSTLEEALQHRLDIDNSDSPSAIAFSPLGDYAFLTLQGNNQVGVVDVLDLLSEDTQGTLQTRWGTGLAPQAVEVNPATGQVITMDFMGRAVSLFDAAGFISAGTLNVPRTAVDAVVQERLHPEVLRGKRIFYNAADTRMSAEGYISCATCHLDGAHDGRTWDFTNRGEGFRNTTDLRGRSGMAHGNVHWSGNFDEIQDFENDIRGFFGGTGFLTTPQFAATEHPLGAPKAGLNTDLDALAAYVSSLGVASIPRNPAREANGAPGEAALRGQAVFQAQGCAVCHIPANGYTDGLMHDVGTLRASSGGRLGGLLNAIDTPTLLGLHTTAPYFHNGSAESLEEVFTTTGGRLVQAEDATLSNGAAAMDIDWVPMKEWHGGEFVEMGASGAVTVGDIFTNSGGPGYIELRYAVQYWQVQLDISMNGGASVPVVLAMTPNVPNYVPNEWRTVRVPLSFVAGNNTLTIAKAAGGTMNLDEIFISTPDDAQRASAHFRNLAAADLADLVAYVNALDASSAGAPGVVIRRDAVIPPGGTDTIALPAGAVHTLVYIIENTGSSMLDLGRFHVAENTADLWTVLQQPAPLVPPGESTALSLQLQLSGNAATAAVSGWSSAPGAQSLAWTIVAQQDGGTGEGEGEEECAGICLEIAAVGPTFVRKAIGDSVTFTIHATGDGPLLYQWYREYPDKALQELNGEEAASLTLTNLDLPDSGSYYCVVSDANETLHGPAFTLVVVPALPAAGGMALAALAAIFAATGAALNLRRKA